MTIESASYPSELVPTNPGGDVPVSELNDHDKLVKHVIKTTFANISGAVTVTHTQLNKIGVTAAPGDNSTDPASTAFVQAAIADVNTQAAIALSIVTDTTSTATAGQHLALSNLALTTVTLPASPSIGDTVWITPINGLTTNVIARNGSNIMSLAEDLTMDDMNQTYRLRFVNSTVGWRFV